MLCAEQCGKEEEERWRGGGCEGRRVRGEEGERERGEGKRGKRQREEWKARGLEWERKVRRPDNRSA